MVSQNTARGVVQPTGKHPPDAEEVASRLALLREVRSDRFTAAVIREALAAGWSQNRISRETGLSRMTVRGILARTPERA